MNVSIEDKDMAMTLLSGLLDRYDGLISTLDAMSDNTEKFTFQFVVSRCQQEEQRHDEREKQAQMKSEAAALISSETRPKGSCFHCGKHDNSDKCWRKYPRFNSQCF